MTQQRSIDDVLSDEVLSEIVRKQRREQAFLKARSPKRVAEIVAEVVRRRGYARQESEHQLHSAWQQCLGELPNGETTISASRIGRLRCGVLEVWVRNSIINQELTFHKAEIIKRLCDLAPDQAIRDIRIRVGFGSE